MKCLWVLITFAALACANFPLLDVDTNMRIVLVPHDAPVGGIIYRLRASDSDNHFPITFEVLGSVGKSLLSLNFLGCVETESLCQADVILKKALDLGRTYEFQLQVKDTTGDYTKVHAAITATRGTANFNPLFAPRIIHLDESTPDKTTLERFEVVKNELNSRPVLLELRESSGRIGLKQRLISNNRTEGTLVLEQKLDFEKEPWFTFQLLALNGWTNVTLDTRNILISEVIVAVNDVQDTPPVFTYLPSSIQLNSSIKTGDLVARVQAEDGDSQNKRLIRYGFLTDSNPFVVFFDLDPMSGEIKLRKNMSELLAIAKPAEPIRMTIVAEEIVSDTERSSGRSGSTLERTMGNITFWFGIGTSIGPPVFSSDKYVGEIMENSPPGTRVDFGGPPVQIPRVFHLNPKEILRLSFTCPEVNADMCAAFQMLPSQGVGNLTFEIRVSDSSLLDFEARTEIRVMIRATASSGLFQEVELTVHIRDENDNAPVFSQSEYRVELPEHPPPGTKVVQLHATDKDKTGTYGQVVYSNLIGSDAFHLDPETGEITVDKPDQLDRETEPEIRLYVEAKDGGHTEFPTPTSPRNLASASVIVKLVDKNDHSPQFAQKYYQAVLNPELTSLKSPVYVKAFDPDEGSNSQVRYQSQDSRFLVDPATGEIRLRGHFNRNPAQDGDGPYLGSFRIRAYDLGNPQMSSETVVQLFSEEMVTREIQIVFPAPPDKIRRNQTNIEKMLSSLTGGVVGIQTITPIGRRSGNSVSSTPNKNKESRALVDDVDNNNSNGHQGPPPEPLKESNNKAIGAPGNAGGASQTRLQKKVDSASEDLSSAADKSLITATVQYPVSATQRVDLSAFQKAYMSGNLNPTNGAIQPTPPPQDNNMIRIYEAENRALFWILISFLLLLLILFAIFLCCVYCPCCWLYGHCYSQGFKEDHIHHHHDDRRVLIQDRHRSRNKTYPDDEELRVRPSEGSPPPLHRTQRRREAWSSEREKGGLWRGERRYNRAPTPHAKRPAARGGPDVSLQDWEFEPSQHSRLQDRAEEIGPRWQNAGGGGGTIAVPVPVSLIPLGPPQGQPVSIQQQQSHSQQFIQDGQRGSRRVAYAGQAHPGDDGFVRRPGEVTIVDEGIGGVVYQGDAGEIRRHYQGPTQSEEERARSKIKSRQTRFFKTETGEILQFADVDGEEGKEMLIKRYVDEQHDNNNSMRLDNRIVRLDVDLDEDDDDDLLPPPNNKAFPVDLSTQERPKGALPINRPPPKRPSETQEPPLETAAAKASTTTSTSRSKHHDKYKPDITASTTDIRKDRKKISESHRRRSHSLSEGSDQNHQNQTTSHNKSHRSKSRRSKSQSKSKSKSPSNSRRNSSGDSSVHSLDSEALKGSSSKKDKEDRKHHKRHHHSHSHSKKADQSSKHHSTTTTSKSKSESKSTSNMKSTKESKGVQSESSSHKIPPTTIIPSVITENTELDSSEQVPMNEVDINVIPPSSAPPTDSSYSPKDEMKVENHKVVEERQQSHVVVEQHEIVTNVNLNVEGDVDAEGGGSGGGGGGGGDDEDSGIGIGGGGGVAKKNKMLEKKSVFTIAYDEVAHKTLRPDTASNNEAEPETNT